MVLDVVSSHRNTWNIPETVCIIRRPYLHVPVTVTFVGPSVWSETVQRWSENETGTTIEHDL